MPTCGTRARSCSTASAAVTPFVRTDPMTMVDLPNVLAVPVDSIQAMSAVTT
jgi:hypothetical protein